MWPAPWSGSTATRRCGPCGPGGEERGNEDRRGSESGTTMRHCTIILLAAGILVGGLDRPAGGQVIVQKQVALPIGGGMGGIASATMAKPVGPAGAVDIDPALADELTLKGAGRGVDGAALLEFFRLRMPARVEPARLAGLVGDLGDKS